MNGSKHARRTTGARRWWRLVLAGCLAFALAVGVAGVGWLAVDALAVRRHLQESARLLVDLRERLDAGDRDGGRQAVARLRAETAAARARTGARPWRAGTHLPRVGADLAALATIARVLDELSRRGLPELADVAATLDPASLAPRGTGVDLSRLSHAEPAIRVADAAVRQARDQVAAVPTAGLTDQVRDGLADLRAGLDQAAAMTATGVRAARLLPAMLGAGGPRTFLVLFQNLAEVRATGGIPSAFAVVRTDRGAVSLVRTGTAGRDLGVFSSPVSRLSEAARQLYTDRPAIFPADVNVSPDFPTAARLFREMYRVRTGETVDGVVATDPVALSYLLAATGPVAVPGGPALTRANAVRMLLSEVYARFRGAAAQDRYFAGATRAMFGALLRGALNPGPAIAALAKAAGERRILVWSARAEERDLLAGTVLAGRLPTDDRARPTVGVFLNDGSGAKLGFYLTQAATLQTVTCWADGRATLRLRLRLRSTAPRSGLPRAVLGLGLAGDPYTVRTQVNVFSPVGGSVVDAREGGAQVALGSGREHGRAVASFMVDLAPGRARTLDVRVMTAPAGGWSGPVRLVTTPGITPWAVSTAGATPCPPQKSD
ncbi:DUF4012 domain-containing protein [Luedemannella helvata]|uniref:DUF4012 domain-containing protein n=1 Tax=Luedemannella helvata TaxID=349315 RepID=A0ABP4X9K3_9ACTN